MEQLETRCLMAGEDSFSEPSDNDSISSFDWPTADTEYAGWGGASFIGLVFFVAGIVGNLQYCAHRDGYQGCGSNLCIVQMAESYGSRCALISLNIVTLLGGGIMAFGIYELLQVPDGSPQEVRG